MFVLLTECYSGDHIRNGLGVASSTYRAQTMFHRVLVGTSRGKKPRRRPTHKRDDNFEMDLRGV